MRFTTRRLIGLVVFIVAFVISLGAPHPASATVSNILIVPTSQSATIYWTSSSKEPSSVIYGILSGALIKAANDPIPVSFHSVTLSPLLPNTTYYFHIVEQKNDQPKLTSTFRTLGSSGTGSSVILGLDPRIQFTKNLKLGITDSEVKQLQLLLNQDKRTQVSQTGPGSPGLESTYFGAKTKSAVIKFQELYKQEILTPNGLSKGTGLFGVSTRTKANSLLALANSKGQIATAKPTVSTPTYGVGGGSTGSPQGGGGGGGSSSVNQPSVNQGGGGGGGSPSPSPTFTPPSAGPSPSPTPSPTPAPSPTPISFSGSYGASPDQGENDDAVIYIGTKYYVDCINGNDTNDGQSPAGAWKTFSQVQTKFPGYWDTLPTNGNTIFPHEPWSEASQYSAFLLKRGCTFIVAKNAFANTAAFIFTPNITIGAYGSGARPILIGSLGFKKAGIALRNIRLVSPTTGFNTGISIEGDDVKIVNVEIEGFQADGVTIDDTTKPKNLLISNSIIANNSRGGSPGNGPNGGGIAGSPDATYGAVLDHLTVANNGNHPVYAHNIYLRGSATVTNSKIYGGSGHGIVAHGDVNSIHYLNIKNNDLYNNSVGVGPTGAAYPAPDEGLHNVVVDSNLIHDNYQYGALASSWIDSLFTNNKMWGNAADLDFSSGITKDEKSHNVLIANNLFTNNLTAHGAASTAIKIVNNIFQGAGDFLTAPNINASEYIIDYNQYFNSSISVINSAQLNFFGQAYTLAGLQAAFGFDTHSHFGDPQLSSGPDFLPMASSPVIDAGTVASLDHDFVGSARPKAGAYDIGPYEAATVGQPQPIVVLPTNYVITASAGTGGSIFPSGAVTVSSGNSQVFTISPNAGYSISLLLVDGSSQAITSDYTFSSVTEPHTIAVVFSQNNAGAGAGNNTTIQPSGLIAHYSFDGNADDSAGSHPGAIQGGATFSAGKLNQALVSGPGSFVSIPSFPTLSSDYSISLWINPADFTGGDSYYTILGFGANTYETPGLFARDNGSVEMYNGHGISAAVLSVGTWVYVVYVNDVSGGNLGRIYINGVASGSTGTAVTTAADLRIGSDGNNESFNGKIDDLRIYGRALSPAEVQALYSGGLVLNGSKGSVTLNQESTAPSFFASIFQAFRDLLY